MVHRYTGYVVMLLVVFGNISAILILPVAMGGGDLNLHFAIVFLAVATTGAMYLAWHNIRRHQIDEHRKWMLRAMFWMGTIVTMRIVMIFMIFAVAYRGGYATVSRYQPLIRNMSTERYAPSCGRATKYGLSLETILRFMGSSPPVA